MADSPEATSWRPRYALHLLWAVPIALGVQLVASFWVALSWCGISGCSGGGFGRVSDPSLPSVLVAAAIVAIAWFAVIAGVPWHRSWRLRLVVGAVLALALAAATAVSATSGFVR